MTCQICHAPASFIYITLDTRRQIPMCAGCVTRHITRALDQCYAHDPRITAPRQAPARLN